MTYGRAYSDDEVEWIREHYREGSISDTVEGFAARFGYRRTAASIVDRARRMGLEKDSHAGNVDWTPERVGWFKAFVPGHTEPEIADAFEDRYGIRLSRTQIKGAKYRYGARSGTAGGRFEKGRPSKTRGRTWDELGRGSEGRRKSLSTCFKPGQEPHNKRPIGAERVDRLGYTWVKVAEHPTNASRNNHWRPKHHLEWERAHGEPVPENTQIVFADGDKGNFEPGNLVAVPRECWAVIIRQKMVYTDAESLACCVALAKLVGKVSAAEKRPRKCGVCGAEFTPRYARQRTCDGCLAHGQRSFKEPMVFKPEGDGVCSVCGARYTKSRVNQVRCPDCIGMAPRAHAPRQRKKMGTRS